MINVFGIKIFYFQKFSFEFSESVSQKQILENRVKVLSQLIYFLECSLGIFVGYLLSENFYFRKINFYFANHFQDIFWNFFEYFLIPYILTWKFLNYFLIEKLSCKFLGLLFYSKLYKFSKNQMDLFVIFQIKVFWKIISEFSWINFQYFWIYEAQNVLEILRFLCFFSTYYNNKLIKLSI